MPSLNRILRSRLNAAGIPVELTYQLLFALVLRAGRSMCFKCAALCLALFAGLGVPAVRAAKAAPAPAAAAASASASVSAAGTGTPSTQESAASGRPVEVRELWTGSLYSSTYRVGVCVSAQGNVRGVVHLRLYNGKVDVYHIDGTVQNNEIEAHHSSGHKFKGRLVTADTVEGVISLKNGMNIKLEGNRAHDVELAPEDCAPLPQ